MAVLVCCLFLNALQVFGYSPEKAEFSVKFKDEVSPFRVMSVFVLPEEEFEFEAAIEAKEERFTINTSAGSAILKGANKWLWKAPKEKGLYLIKIIHDQSKDFIDLNVFVMVPYSQLKGEYLNGYRIGKYPVLPLKKLPIYKPPRGFIEVTEENQDTVLSPHFQLKQFLCKQNGGYPKYIVLRERLLLKLELLLEQANAFGYQTDTFSILSGFRTPYYNKLIGNVKYSRHIYGGAADIFIDLNPKDEMMDDLNKDGRIDHGDAAILYDIVDGIHGKPWYIPYIGGLGKYKHNASHGPFVHVDVRGFHARWGT